jgi:GAF domain-containing protein
MEDAQRRDVSTPDRKNESRVKSFASEVVNTWAVSWGQRALNGLLILLAAGIGLLFALGGTVSVGVFAVSLLAVVVFSLLVIAVTMRRKAAQLGEKEKEIEDVRAEKDREIEGVHAAKGQEIEELTATKDTEINELVEQLDRFDWALERHEMYGAHVCQMMDNLQRVIAGDIPGVSIPNFIERGVLEPARDVMRDYGHNSDLRLSILLPTGTNGNFRMQWAAGHHLDSQKKYDIPMVDTLARFPFERSVMMTWGDVHDDPNFKPNPHATRDFHSMVSIPISVGESPLGVLNVITDQIDAFDPADINYLTALRAVIDVAVGVHAKGVMEQKSQQTRSVGSTGRASIERSDDDV